MFSPLPNEPSGSRLLVDCASHQCSKAATATLHLTHIAIGARNIASLARLSRERPHLLRSHLSWSERIQSSLSLSTGSLGIDLQTVSLMALAFKPELQHLDIERSAALRAISSSLPDPKDSLEDNTFI